MSAKSAHVQCKQRGGTGGTNPSFHPLPLRRVTPTQPPSSSTLTLKIRLRSSQPQKRHIPFQNLTPAIRPHPSHYPPPPKIPSAHSHISAPTSFPLPPTFHPPVSKNSHRKKRTPAPSTSTRVFNASRRYDSLSLLHPTHLPPPQSTPPLTTPLTHPPPHAPQS